jgi:hypothetical protein
MQQYSNWSGFNPRSGRQTGATTKRPDIDGGKNVSIRAPVVKPERLRPLLSIEPQRLSTSFARRCQDDIAFLRCVCQRAIESVHKHWSCASPRNPGWQVVTHGSRKTGHRINGSLRSIGLSMPWCSVFSLAVSSRK